MHSSHTQITVDETAQLSFSLSNALAKPKMIARLTLDLPSGWSMDGEGFANKCSGICTANHEVPTGDQRYIEVSAYPNHTGTFLLEGRVEFTYEGKAQSYFVKQDVHITVTPAQPTAALPAPQPTPAVIVATPTPPAAPAVAQPTPTPIVIVVTQAPAGSGGGQSPEVEGGSGCSAPPPDAPGAVDPSLLLAGLLLPAGILARLGISRRRANANANAQIRTRTRRRSLRNADAPP